MAQTALAQTDEKRLQRVRIAEKSRQLAAILQSKQEFEQIAIRLQRELDQMNRELTGYSAATPLARSHYSELDDVEFLRAQ